MSALPVGSADIHLLPPVLSTNPGSINWTSRILRFSGNSRKTHVGVADTHLLPVGSADIHLLPPVLSTTSGAID